MTSRESAALSSTSNDTLDESVPASVLAGGPGAVQHYLKMIRDGQESRFAEMCALQCPPGVKGSDRAVMQGRYNMEWMNKLTPQNRDRILNTARRAGINISGKFYQSGLADRRGPADPAAWIDSAADIKRVAQERNLHVTGIVEHVAREVAPPPSKPLSERIIRREMRRYSKQHPNMKPGEMREMIVSKHAPRHKRGGK